MRYLSFTEAIDLYRWMMKQTGGVAVVRDPDALLRALAEPRALRGNDDLYPTLVDKAAALGFSLLRGCPFQEGGERGAHAITAVFLGLNGLEIQATVEQQERIIVRLRAGELDRAAFADWLRRHTVAKEPFQPSAG